MKTTPLSIGGKQFQLVFDMDALAEMEARMEGFNFAEIEASCKSLGPLLTMVTIMAEQGAKVTGTPMQADRDWFGRIKPTPTNFCKLQTAAYTALAEGIAMETDQPDPNAEKDLVLEELKKTGLRPPHLPHPRFLRLNRGPRLPVPRPPRPRLYLRSFHSSHAL